MMGLMPPVPFTELEKVKGSLQISEVVSASPSTLSGDLIRDTYKLSHDNQLATILDKNIPLLSKEESRLALQWAKTSAPHPEKVFVTGLTSK